MNNLKPRKMKIVMPIDIYGNSFEPELDEYEVIYTHEVFVALGIQGSVLRKVIWQNVEEI